MKAKGVGYAVLAFILIIAVSGCSTVPKKFKEEVSGIKSRVETLESRVEGVESKQSETERQTSEQMQAIDELKTRSERIARSNISVKSKVSPKIKSGIREIQTCLKNSGFYDGKIDGVRGRGTRKAIKEFQRANGLKADGRVGPKTWELLNKYSSGLAAEAGVSAEGGEAK
jgi:murein L,D-transpeptidase YcbB/YkuD